MIRRELLDRALLAMLRTATTKQGDLVQVPVKAVTPYFILYPLTAPEGTGTMRDPEEDREFYYQITSVGVDHRETTWMSDRVQAAMIARSGNGYTTALVVAGGTIQNRHSRSLGTVERSGERLFKVDDDYAIKAGR